MKIASLIVGYHDPVSVLCSSCKHVITSSSCRLADSGFMTCQLAQILAPIRAASAPLVSSDDAPATPPKSSANGSSQRQPQQAADHMFVAPAVTPAVTRFEPSMTAAAVADPAQEARLEAAAEGLLAEIGIDCSSQTMTRADSDACSEFEMVPAAAADMDTKISAKGLDAGQWLGPAVQLVKTTSATLDSASYDIPDSAESAAFYSPRLQSASEPEFALVAMHDVRTSSTVSVGDVRLETAGDDSRMTEQARQPAAVCAAAIDNGSETGFGESASGSGSDSDSVLSLVSASSFGDEEMVDDLESPEEWEMI